MPPPGAPPQQGGQADNALAPLWITILIFAILGLIWYMAHTQIVAFIFKIKLMQAELVGLFTNQINSTITDLKSLSPADVSFSEMMNVSSGVGWFIRYPVVIILAILAFILYSKDITARYRRTYTMKALAEAEQINWPQIKCVLKLDLINQDINKGPWAMAMTPMRFAKRYKLLQEEPTVVTELTLMHQIKPTVSVLRNRAREIFTLQLGRYWEGMHTLNPHTKALFAIFAARINRDRDGANQLMLQISQSVDKGKLNFSGADALLNKHKNTKLVQEIVNRHAFLLTVMAGMLEGARTDGVIATADFLWLKPIDRSLWYMMSSIGRQTPFVEVAGPFAHYIAEKKVGRHIMVPLVEEAVNALEVAIKEVLYVPENED